MIWHAGKILQDEDLTIPITDRTFEHGLGLFETMRTWGGRALFLQKHRDRMLRSAELLGLTIEADQFPDHQALAQLLEVQGDLRDQRLRVTASGGFPSEQSRVWMRSSPILSSPRGDPYQIQLGSWTISRDDPLARHKSLNYWTRRMALAEASKNSFDETIGYCPGLGYVEGSCSNLFLIRDRALITPSLEAPIIPGLMRGFVRDLAGEIGIATHEVPGVSVADFGEADEVFLTNAVWGIRSVAFVGDSRSPRTWQWPAPGSLTRDLQTSLIGRLLPSRPES